MDWTTIGMALAGALLGWALTPYTSWIITLRRGGTINRHSASPCTLLAWAPLINGLGWGLAWALANSHLSALELSLLLTAALALTAIDLRIRIIPNELVAALLVLSAAFALMEHGLSALPMRLVGMAVALVMFVGTALLGLGKIGGGDIKLSLAIGFAAGFPNVLVAVAAMGLVALASRLWDNQPWNLRLKTQLPFAGFMMIGLLAALVLDQCHLLQALGL